MENFEEVFNVWIRKLKGFYVKEDIIDYVILLFDFIFYGFNMEDELVGGYEDK